MMAALMAGSLFATGSLQAQDNTNTPPTAPAPGAPGGRARMTPEQLTKDLGLSDDQQAKFKEAMQDMRKKQQDLRKDTTLAQEDKRAKMKEINEAFQAKAKEILTAEQFAKLQKLMPGPRNRPAAATPKN